MGLDVTDSNNRKIYNLSENKTFEEFLEKHKNNLKSLKKDGDYLGRIELI